MKEERQKTINKIIDEKYDPHNKRLNLWVHTNYWQEVLNNRDWTILQQLHLTKCSIVYSDINTILVYKWPCLKQLWLNYNNIGSKGVKLLIKAELNQLQRLSLGCSCIDSEGAKYLSKGKWDNLKFLILCTYVVNEDGNNIKMGGYDQLGQGYWLYLQQVFLSLQKNDKLDPILSYKWITISKILKINKKIANKDINCQIDRIFSQKCSKLT